MTVKTALLAIAAAVALIGAAIIGVPSTATKHSAPAQVEMRSSADARRHAIAPDNRPSFRY